MLKNMKIAQRTSLLLTGVLVFCFWGLWKLVDNTTTEVMDKQIEAQMTDAVESRAYVINNYVQEAEEYLIAFGKSDEVKNLLNNLDSKEYQKRAQEYTVEFANVKGIFEGLYIADTETGVYTHTTESVVGMHNREGERLKQFQDTILSKQELSNGGVMKSPSTGNMVISMYYPIYDQGKCIGFVGAAVYAGKLMDSLISLDVKGLENSEYVFLDSEGKYLYNEDEELLCTVTEDKGYIDILDKIKSGKTDTTGMYEYVDSEGKEIVLVYNYLTDRDWMFAIRDDKEDVYSELKKVKKYTGVCCVINCVVIIIILNLILSAVSGQLGKISKAIKKLGDMDLSADKSLEKYSGQKDEVGIVCDALHTACTNLRKYIGEVDASLSKMASGDYTEVRGIEFEGDFKALQVSIGKIRHALNDSFSEIGSVTQELQIGSQSVAEASSHLAEAATQASCLVTEIDDYINDISGQLSESTGLAMGAKEKSGHATELVASSREKMDELNAALVRIKQATASIQSISNDMERFAKQTNILSLNALVEASRAGTAGLGFGVVADEIRMLAEQSAQASVDAYELIKDTLDAVERGMTLGDETSEYLSKVVEHTTTIDTDVSRIAQAAKTQDEKLSGINDRLRDISRTVESTAAMAEESAAASVELDGQVNVLRNNISQYTV